MTVECVAGCGGPTETTMCAGCARKLFDDLREVEWLLPELDITITRQAKLSSGGVGFVTGNGGGSMPLHLGASAVAAELRDRLARWVLNLWEEHGVRWHRCTACGVEDRTGEGAPACAPGCPTKWETHLDPLNIPLHPLPLSRWLLRHPSWVQSYSDGAALFDDIRSAVRHAKSTVYGPGERAFLGICSAPIEAPVGDDGDTVLVECQRDLYGAKGRPWVACPECGAEWDAVERRRWMLHRMRDELLTATELSRALPNYLERPDDKPVTASMIRGYAKRGRLVAHGYAPGSQDPRYRVGDLLDILEPTAAAS
ncbi:hypothetical protein ACWEF6_02775 [Amycolatopsis sp. NPDC004772]